MGGGRRGLVGGGSAPRKLPRGRGAEPPPTEPLSLCYGRRVEPPPTGLPLVALAPLLVGPRSRGGAPSYRG